MYISRLTGTTSENLLVFINDATVSTGAGLANIVASSVSFSWCRDNQATISSGIGTTGTLGTYTVSSFVQASSTSSLGWYMFCVPDGVFVSGKKGFVHLYGAPSMAPLPILIELTKTDNQTSMSSQTVSTTLNSLGVVMTDKAGYGVSSVNTGVNVTSVVGSAIVTSAAGIINVSTQTIDKAGYGVSSVNTGVNITSVVGSPAVTTAAGIQAVAWDLGRTANLTSTLALTGVSMNLVTTVSIVSDKSGYGVSSVNTGVNVSSIVGTAAVTTQAGIFATVFDLSRTANPNSTVSFSSLSISSQSVSVGAVNVSSVNGSPIVTSGPGVISTAFDLSNILNPTSTVSLTNLTISANQNVSTIAGGVTITTNNDKTGYSTVDWTTAIGESFRTQNATGTPAQILYELLANITEASNSATTRTINSVTSHVAKTITYGYDSSTSPSSITRTA